MVACRQPGGAAVDGCVLVIVEHTCMYGELESSLGRLSCSPKILSCYLARLCTIELERRWLRSYMPQGHGHNQLIKTTWRSPAALIHRNVWFASDGEDVRYRAIFDSRFQISNVCHSLPRSMHACMSAAGLGVYYYCSISDSSHCQERLQSASL